MQVPGLGAACAARGERFATNTLPTWTGPLASSFAALCWSCVTVAPEPFQAYAAQLDAIAKAAEELRIPTNFRPLKSPLICLSGLLVVFLRSDFFS